MKAGNNPNIHQLMNGQAYWNPTQQSEKNKLLTETAWRKLKRIILSERRKTQKPP